MSIYQDIAFYCWKWPRDKRECGVILRISLCRDTLQARQRLGGQAMPANKQPFADWHGNFPLRVFKCFAAEFDY